MRFVVEAVVRLAHTLLTVVVYLVCIACVTFAGGMSGRAAADMPGSARAPHGPRAISDDQLRTGQLAQCAHDEQLPAEDSSSSDDGSPDSTSEEDDQNDVADEDPLVPIEREGLQLLRRPLVCRLHPAAQSVAARDHNALDPRPPRA